MKIIKRISVKLAPDYTQVFGLTKNGELHREGESRDWELCYLKVDDLDRIERNLPKAKPLVKAIEANTQQRNAILRDRDEKQEKINRLRREAAELERELSLPNPKLTELENERDTLVQKLQRIRWNLGHEYRYAVLFRGSQISIGCNRFYYKDVPVLLKRFRDAIKKSPLLK